MEQTKESIAVGNRLRDLRLYFGLKQGEFADRIKVHQSSVALFESGKRYLKDIYVKIICDEFSCEPDWLRDGKGEMLKDNTHVSIDEYAKIYKLSNLERDIISNFMELEKETKRESLDSFVQRLLVYNQKVK